MEKIDANAKKEVDALGDVPPSRFTPRSCCLPAPAQFVLVAVLGSFQFGYSFSALNTSKAIIIADFDWCKGDANHFIDCSNGVLYGSLITTAVFIGLTFGCLLAGPVTNFGRRVALILTNLLFLVSSALAAAAEGVASLFLARLYQGLAVGLATVCVPMYISEFTPDSSRGFYGTLHQLLITIGILVATLLGLAFGSPPTDTDFTYKVSLFQQCWWRFMLAFPAAVSIVAILLLWLVYTTESPHFLMHQGRKNTATALLREILGKEDVSHEVQTIDVAICQQKVLEAESLSLGKAMTFPIYRHVLLLAFFLSAFQQFTGINILVANSNKLYTSLNIDASLVTGLSVVFGFVNVLMTVPAIFLMDRLGRRTLLLSGCFGQAASTIIALIANLVDRHNTGVQWLTVACIYVFVISFAVGYGPVLWVYLHEIFPPEIKQTGASVASAINAVATIIVVLPSDFVLTSDMRVMLGICGGTSLIAFIISFIFMKETAGLSIDESPYFKGKRRVMSKYFDVTGLNNAGQPVPSLASGHFSATQLAPAQAPSFTGKELTV
ncbi:facilitative glucose transporter, putative [Eimeria tenella]|uniref:Hexose transporter 1 n=1 Tax=Eimeria tenella TaxID=5802 RepID=D7RXM4_EIMTE|nr:facilitative glucose transporter, putative [Eimeria tenella]ADI71926.1 putative hexose transporter 1 [Eimeria tenella]CDJ40285.1 facilitative glucose transporter, putative [Eimeria tenella]|eukprot:XP_013231038.1 facilitative glucose transporter, putative [Eimeria tenella]